MEEDGEGFTSVMSLTMNGGKRIPEQYILPPPQRPNANLSSTTFRLPVIDVSMLNDAASRSEAIYEIQGACKTLGFFQVINHGIPVLLMEEALDSANQFFHSPKENKMQFASTNVHDPVRYGTSLNHVTNNVLCWRDFIKHYANPISQWIHLWPHKPLTYRKKMGSYAKAVHALHMQLMGAVLDRGESRVENDMVH